MPDRPPRAPPKAAPAVGEKRWNKWEHAYRALADDPDCTAIYAANDQMAYGAMLGLQSAGKRVPEDVSIVGVDDSLVDMVPRLNLTTMKLRFDDIGATAFSMVRRQCEGEKIPVGVKTVIPPELIERGSVRDIS